MNKKYIASLAIIILACSTIAAADTSTTPSKEAAEPEYRVRKGGESFTIVPVGAYFSGGKLHLHAVTIHLPRKWRVVSVSHGKMDGSYLVTMDTMEYFGNKLTETFTLDLAHKTFLDFASEFLSKRYVPNREKKPVTLEADFTIYWSQQPREKLVKAN